MAIFLAVGGAILLYALITLISYGSFYLCRGSLLSAYPENLSEDNLKIIQADAYFQRGNLFHKMSMFGDAIQNYNEAVTRDPSHPMAKMHHNYAMLKKLVPSLSFEKDQGDASGEQDAFTPLGNFLQRNETPADEYTFLEGSQDDEIRAIDPADTALDLEVIEDAPSAASDSSEIELSVTEDSAPPEKSSSVEPQMELNFNIETSDQPDTSHAISSTSTEVNLDLENENDNNGIAPYQLGQTFHQQGILADAINEYDKAIAANPNFIDAYMSRASALLKLKRFDAAIVDFDTIIELDPNHIKARNKRGNIFLHQNKLDDAINDYTVALAIDPNHPKCLIRRGSCYFRKQLFDNAVTDFTNAINRDPANREAYTNRGMSYKKLGQDELAKTDFAKAERIKQNPTDNKTTHPSEKVETQANILSEELEQVFVQAMTEVNNKNEPQALLAFDRIIKDAPNHADSYLQRANIHFNNKRFDHAITDYGKSIEYNPIQGEAYCKRGQANIQTNLYIDAINDFNKAIEIMPEDIEAYLNRGKANSQRAQRDEAIADFSKVIELAPDNEAAFYARGIEWQNLGEYDKALSDLDKACNLGNNAACVAYLNIQSDQE